MASIDDWICSPEPPHPQNSRPRMARIGNLRNWRDPVVPLSAFSDISEFFEGDLKELVTSEFQHALIGCVTRTRCSANRPQLICDSHSNKIEDVLGGPLPSVLSEEGL